MTVVNNKDLSVMKDCLLAIRSFVVNATDGERSCPYLMTWCGTDLVKRRYALGEYIPSPFGGEDTSVMKVHGFTSPHTSQLNEWDRYRELPPILNQNVQDFFMSDIQVAYMNLAREVDEEGSLLACCPAGWTKAFYPEGTMSLDCLLVPLENKETADKSNLLQFLEEIVNNDMLMSLFQQFQRTHIQRLVNHGLKIKVDEENSCRVYNDTHYVFPLEAVQQMMDLCQELEVNNFLYYNSHMEDGVSRYVGEPIQCHVLVPKSDRPMNLTVSIEIALGSLEGQDDMEVDENVSWQDDTDTSDWCVGAKIIPLSRRLHFGGGPGMRQMNASMCAGPLAVKRKFQSHLDV